MGKEQAIKWRINTEIHSKLKLLFLAKTFTVLYTRKNTQKEMNYFVHSDKIHKKRLKWRFFACQTLQICYNIT